MASIKFYINKSKDKWAEEETLYAKFTHRYAHGDYRNLKIFSPEPIRLDPNKWDTKAQKVIGKSSAALKLQQKINEEHKRIADAWAELEESHARYGTIPEIEELRDKLKGATGAVSTQSYNTLPDLVDLYLEEKRLSFANKTIEFYNISIKGVLSNFKKDTHQSMKIEHIDLTFFSRFKGYCAGRGCKNQSTNSYLEKICAVLRWHHDNGTDMIRERINLDFMRVKKLPTSKKGERDHISEEEALFLYGLNMSHKFSVVRDIYLFMVFTGPRFGDTLNSLRVETNVRELQLSDGRTVHVLWFIQQKTKGEEEVVVPLNNICEEIIRRNNPGDHGLIFNMQTMRRNGSARQMNRSGTFNSSLRHIFNFLRDFYVHVNDNRGAFLNGGYEEAPSGVRRAARWLGFDNPTPAMGAKLEGALKLIEGLMKKRETVDYVGNQRVSEVYERWEKLTAHTARHSFGSLLAAKGASVKEAQKMLGHRISRTTEKYFHIDQEKAVQKISGMLAMPLMKAV